MKALRHLLCLMAAWCVCFGARAQFDTDYSEDLDLFYDEDEPEDTVPPHKEYANMFYVQYSPSRYHFSDITPHLHFQEFAVGYARSFQVQEKTPLFVEGGVQMKYSYSKGDAAHANASYRILTFRIPINVVYKFYFSQRDIALAPFAGVNLHLAAWGREKLDGTDNDLYDHKVPNATGAEWERIQLGWQTGVKLCLYRTYIGISYGRDFPDKSKLPDLHECSVHVGFGF